MEERERKTKVKWTEGETRWREGFGAPMPDPLLVLRGPGASKGTPGDAKCVTEILGEGEGQK